MDYLRISERNKERMLEYRRHLHENPELSGEEFNTLRFIREKLEECGITYAEVKDGGILGFIDGKGPGKRILLRADCDALPMEESPLNEKGAKSCVSKNPEAAHTCGHDFHTASLLTVAGVLSENRHEWRGSVLLYFERSEEKKGLFQYNLLKYIEKEQIRIDGCFAFHVNVGLSGVATIIEGPSHAGSFSFQYTLEGKGGHGARPYMANNPIPCFQVIAGEIDRLRMNRIDPFMPVTLTICNVQSGHAANVIPDSLSFGGNGRYFNREKAGLPIKAELEHIVKSQGEAHGCKVTGGVSTPGIPNVNSPECARFAYDIIKENFGEDHVVFGEPSMGSETFAYLSALYPSLLLFFGVVSEEKGITYGIHHPKFDIDEEKAHLATAYTLAYAVEFLNSDIEFVREGFLNSVEALKEIL